MAILFLPFTQQSKAEGAEKNLSFAAGMSLLGQEKFDESAAFFGNYTVTYPTDSRGFNNLGFSLFKLGLENEALQQYLAALKLDP